MKNIYDMSENEITDILTKYTEIKKKEKREFGEVMTHPDLIDKILDLFPKNIWENPVLKWLDPSCGIGNFMILLHKRLMIGLDKWEPDRFKRHKHIIENMLYMVELNQDNYHVCCELFGEKNNIICADFLSDHNFVKQRFDCILGNPPFQDNSNVKRGVGKSKLYERIFLKAYDLLNANGYISLITPTNIFSGSGVKSYNLLINNNVSFVSLNKNIKQYFPSIQQEICYFIMQKTCTTTNTINLYTTTKIENQTGDILDIKLTDRRINPISNWTLETEQLTNKYIGLIRNRVKYNRGKNVSEYTGSKYAIIYSSSKKLATNKLELAVGFGVKKVVIFAMSLKNEFEMDYSGEFGVGPNTFYIPFDSNIDGEKIEQFLKSNEYAFLVTATKSHRQYMKISFIEYLKPFL
jgi:hypothetical protein